MALKLNTNIKNDQDGYLLDSRNVKAGFIVIYNGETKENNFNIPELNLVVGTTVYDYYDQKTWRYKGPGEGERWEIDNTIQNEVVKTVKTIVVDGGEITI